MNKQSKELLVMGRELEKLFPGYIVSAVNPGIVLTRWEKHQSGKSTPIDTISFSKMAAECLLTKKEPARVLRWDL